MHELDENGQIKYYRYRAIITAKFRKKDLKINSDGACGALELDQDILFDNLTDNIIRDLENNKIQCYVKLHQPKRVIIIDKTDGIISEYSEKLWRSEIAKILAHNNNLRVEFWDQDVRVEYDISYTRDVYNEY